MRSEPGREVPLARVVGGGVLLLVLGVLVLQFVGMFLGDDLESWEVKAPAAGAAQRAGTAMPRAPIAAWHRPTATMWGAA